MGLGAPPKTKPGTSTGFVGKNTSGSPLEWEEHIDANTGFIDWKSLLGTGVSTGAVSATETVGSATMDIMDSEAGDPSALLPSSAVINPLGSLPSISNIGVVNPSGTVNWSGVPGGFQPLPQTAGNRKRLHQISQFHGGINLRSSPRDIADNECSDGINCSFNEVGRIKVIGDCKRTNNSVTLTTNTTKRTLPGFGLFQFTSPADHDAATTGGEFVLTLVSDGNRVDIYDHNADGNQADWMDLDNGGGSGTDDETIGQIFYAAGSGVYVTDSSYSANNISKAKIYVYRKDFNGLQTTGGWADIDSKGGKVLIDSPKHDTGANTAGAVFLDFDDGSVAFPGSNLTATNYGATTVHVGSSGSGTWNGDYVFYISWLFDNGAETGLSSLLTSGGKTFANEQLSFNFSCLSKWNATEYSAGTLTNSKHIGLDNDGTYTVGEPRIDGARIYFKKTTDNERFLLAEVSLVDGIKGALDSTFTSWTEASDVFYLGANLTFDDPPEVYTYFDKNGYFADEIYSASADVLADDTVGPTLLSLKYKTVTTGPQGIIYIGNVEFNGKSMPDGMMCSMPGRPGVFPKFNFFDSPSSDGSPIRALASFQDKILQFKKSGLYVINVSAGSPNTHQFYTEEIFRDCGVLNQCQVFTTSFGVIFVNKFGVFVYDGQKVISLTGGKFQWTTQSNITEDVSNSSTAVVPSIGYDPHSQDIVVLNNIGDDSSSYDDRSWIYSMTTQSWCEGHATITNGNGQSFTNFIITAGGYLSLKSSGSTLLYNYNHVPSVAVLMVYISKDIDFGLPSQTKKIYKIYVTYKGDGSAAYVTVFVDGATSGALDTTNSETGTKYFEDADTTDLNVATFTIDSPPANPKSIRIALGGTCETDFEINDISILYRPRPIK